MIPPTDTTATASSGRRWSACLAAACLAGLLLVPTDASGADLEPGAGGCSDPLVSYSPAGQHGDVQAVAIVAQSFEQGTTGWAHIAWQAAPGTTLTAVHVVSGGIATSLTGALSSGVADAVERIDFCGSSTPEGSQAGSAPFEATPDDAGADLSVSAGDSLPEAAEPSQPTTTGVAPGAADDDQDPASQDRRADEAARAATERADGDEEAAGANAAPQADAPGDAGGEGGGDAGGPVDAEEPRTTDIDVDPDLGTSLPASPPDEGAPQPGVNAVDVVLATSGTDTLSVGPTQTGPDPAAVPRGVAIGLTAGALVLLSTRRRDEEGTA